MSGYKGDVFEKCTCNPLEDHHMDEDEWEGADWMGEGMCGCNHATPETIDVYEDEVCNQGCFFQETLAYAIKLCYEHQSL